MPIFSENYINLRDRASLVAQWYRTDLPMQETWVQSLGQEDPLEEEMATQFSIFAWRVPWTGQSVQSMGLQRARHDIAIKQ